MVLYNIVFLFLQDFVKFIVKGLEGNVLQPFAEGNFRKADLAAQNQVSWIGFLPIFRLDR
jgi:hypothetical protein